MKTSTLLKKARQLISDPEAWTQEMLATDDLGLEVSPRSGRAVCWCMSGALQRFSRDFDDARQVLLDAIGTRRFLADWNDDPDRTHAEVLAAFDKAIASVEWDYE